MARSVASTGASGAAAPSGAVQGSGKPDRKMKVKKETIEFLRQKKFKLLSQIEGNSVNDCDVCKVRNFCQGRPL
jgi:radical SAM protein with 4Fe4S-binding SPASM domain